jgi:hypothetical protein
MLIFLLLTAGFHSYCFWITPDPQPATYAYINMGFFYVRGARVLNTNNCFKNDAPYSTFVEHIEF